MAQPESLQNTRSQSMDTLYAADGTPLVKLGVGEVAVGGLTPVAGWQGAATHADGATFAASDGVVVAAGLDGTTVRKLLVDSTGRLLTVQVPTQGTLTDKSGTITSGGTQQTLAASNTTRKYLMVQNIDASEDLWINFGSNAVVATAGSIQIKAGVIFEMKAFVSTQLVSVIATTTAHKFTAKEA